MEGTRGWKLYDWEAFPHTRKGHDVIISHLIDILKSKYHLNILPFDRKEAKIAEKHSLHNPHVYVAHEPDIIITKGVKPEDRIFIEYVNNEKSFLFDLTSSVPLRESHNITSGNIIMLAEKR